MSELEALKERIARLEDDNERIKNAIIALCDAAVTAAAVGAVSSRSAEALKHLAELRTIIRVVASEIYPDADDGQQ